MKQFVDSIFLIAAWRQLLETQAPGAGACVSGDRVVTVAEALACLRGQVVDPIVAIAVKEYLMAVVSEACRVVRGRFAIGLPSK